MNGEEITNAFGRRDYDVQITRLEMLVVALQKENLELRVEMTEEFKELRLDIKGLVQAWNSAKGFTSFVKWLSGILLGIAGIIAVVKGIK